MSIQDQNYTVLLYSFILLGLTGWGVSQITVILELGVSKTVRYTSYNVSDLQKWRVFLNNDHSAKHAISSETFIFSPYLTRHPQPSLLDPLMRPPLWQLPGRQRNTPLCFQRTCLNQLQLRISARSVVNAGLPC